ncbi:terminase-like family protein [mine drainage metagenome]|uniref:Terminase-like family protein n=1 Tax=mine drainage metagenome TaxID=410659 RepID=A0A1J5QW73_9ZZZZ
MNANPLALDLLAAADPAVLAQRIGITPDAWQLDVLRSTEARLCLLCSRQAGKSTVSAVLALHAALYEPGSVTLIAAPSQRQSIEMFRTITRFYRALGRPIAAEAENTQALTLENGSRIVSLPGDERTTRGFSAVRLLIIDEAARVPDEFLDAVRPMLAVSGGRLVALSTPFGRRGWFHRAATTGRGWKVVRVTADQCPRISPEFLAEEREAMGDWQFKQEYGCEFVSASGSYFDPADIAALSCSSVLPLFGGVL